MKLNIVYEDDDVIIINKPAGLIVHAGIKTGETLVDVLLDYYPEIISIGSDHSRPGIVHRLDKDTSGLMVVAKNNRIFDYLKKQFQERNIEKRYIALAHGYIKNKQGIIFGEIGRLGNKQFVVNQKSKIKNQNGNAKFKIIKSKNALTEYKVLKYINGYTLVEVRPKTGRMHQIRVHFKSIGHPIAGDKKYGFKKYLSDKIFTRQFLHSAHLSFSLPGGRKMVFETDLPEDLRNMLLCIENNA